MMDIKACRVSPSQMVQTVSVDVADSKAVEEATAGAVAKQGPVQVHTGYLLGDGRRARVAGSTFWPNMYDSRGS